jgi:peptide deformylase
MILTDPDKLRLPCSEVESLEEALPIIQKLEEELLLSAERGYPGIGLAAPQIGIYKRVAIVRLIEHKINLINAEIKNAYDKKLFESEGCLSFPGRSENTMRYMEVEVENEFIKPNRFVATGLLAVVCQHEIEHTLGILLPDRALQKQIINKSKIRPNDPCICGSGKKYKKCCYK